MTDFDINAYDIDNPSEFAWMLRNAQRTYGWSNEEFSVILNLSSLALMKWKTGRLNAPATQRRIACTLADHLSSSVDR